MRLLERLGLSSQTYSEVIMITEIGQGRYNAAPVGVRLVGELLVLRLFRESLSYALLKRSGRCTLSLAWSPDIFYRSVMNLPIPVRTPSGFTMPIVEGCDAAVEAEVVEVVEGDPATFLLKPLKTVVFRRMPRAFNRAVPAIIEALVHYTRIPVYCRMGLGEKLHEAINRIKYCVDAVLHSTRDPVMRGIALEILKHSIALADLCRVTPP